MDSEPHHTAFELAATFAGRRPRAVRRFTTGSHHYVFEAEFADRPPIVVRISRPEHRSICADAARLSRALRPLGVPLPEILAEGADAPLPYLLLERLPGRDLGDVLNALQPKAFEAIARRIADVQAVVAGIGGAGRYGYAAAPERAPHATWAEVLNANLSRARPRIAAAGLFDAAPLDQAAALVNQCRDDLNAIPATPFLHDTTTKNVIVTADGRLSGIVDVDDLCFGDPRYAAALALMGVLNQHGPVEYVDAWLNRAGQRKDRLFWLYVAVFAVDFMSEHGQVFNGNPRPSSADQRRRLQGVFGHAVGRVR